MTKLECISLQYHNNQSSGTQEVHASNTFTSDLQELQLIFRFAKGGEGKSFPPKLASKTALRNSRAPKLLIRTFSPFTWILKVDFESWFLRLLLSISGLTKHDMSVFSVTLFNLEASKISFPLMGKLSYA